MIMMNVMNPQSIQVRIRKELCVLQWITHIFRKSSAKWMAPPWQLQRQCLNNLTLQIQHTRLRSNMHHNLVIRSILRKWVKWYWAWSRKYALILLLGYSNNFNATAPAPSYAPSIQESDEYKQIVAQVMALTDEQILKMPQATQQQVWAMRQANKPPVQQSYRWWWWLQLESRRERGIGYVPLTHTS